MAKEAVEKEVEPKHCSKCGAEWTGNPYAPEECPNCRRQRERTKKTQEREAKEDWRDIKAGHIPKHQKSLEEFQK